jgi:hypothetical protein
MIIDDFITGPHRALVRTGEEDRHTQTGAGILGGLRNTWIGFITNPYDTLVNIDVGTRGLVLATGPRAAYRMELTYGFGDNWLNATNLSLDLSPYRALRFQFGSNDQPLAVNVYLTAVTPAGPSYFQWGGHVHVPEGAFDMPLREFRPLGSETDLSRVRIGSIWLIFFPALFGSDDFVITSFEAV